MVGRGMLLIICVLVWLKLCLLAKWLQFDFDISGWGSAFMLGPFRQALRKSCPLGLQSHPLVRWKTARETCVYVFMTNLLEEEAGRVGKEKVEEVGTDHGLHICLMPGSFCF